MNPSLEYRLDVDPLGGFDRLANYPCSPADVTLVYTE